MVRRIAIVIALLILTIVGTSVPALVLVIAALDSTRVFRLARARPPAGFFTKLLVAPMPEIELSAIGGAAQEVVDEQRYFHVDLLLFRLCDPSAGRRSLTMLRCQSQQSESGAVLRVTYVTPASTSRRASRAFWPMLSLP